MKEIIYNLENLRELATPVKFIDDIGISRDEGDSIIAELKEVMNADKTILALAAPQIGINKRVFCIRFNDIIKTFINPIITKKHDCIIAPETFLAMPGKEILIARPKEVTVVYYTDDFKYEDNKLLGPAARIFDQMIQLLDGILPDELGLVSDVEHDGSLSDLTEEEMKEVIEYYKQFISIKTKALETEINTNDTASKTYQNLRLTESIINGRTQIIADEEDTEAKPRTLNYKQRRSIDKLTKKYLKKQKEK